MMKKLLIIMLLLMSTVASGQKSQICFSIDDMPVVSYGINDSNYQKMIFNSIMSSLVKNKIPAIGFVNERKIRKEADGGRYQKELLKNWIKSGLELGNHTYSHPDFNNVSCKEYTSDILKGEPILKEILSESGKSIKYFRHPFLHVGETKSKADSLDAFLKEHGYKVAPVTIDNDDYLFALAYKKASDVKDTILMSRIGFDYIDYMEKKLHFYERQSVALFGRKIPQILLIHASLLNAVYLDSLASMYKRNGYEFADMDTALRDEAYNSKVTSYGKWGISWIDRWAISSGKKGDFFNGDPVAPDYIK
ncbi:MAG: polysaccharide deacetylase family protein [Bacteroidales bacterium]|nr:polysaccharide deacetylase family protein [Bacteroidales bacterium]